MTIDQAAEIVYNSVHAGGYENTWNTANDKGKWRSAIAGLVGVTIEPGPKVTGDSWVEDEWWADI